MKNLRSIKRLVKAMKVNMGGILLDQALPLHGIDQIDPFLLVHHLKDSYEKGTSQSVAGVPPHPHRGFAPVSLIYQGGVHHRDSLNISSVVYAGGTQWMHAGKGIVHSERPPKEVAENGGTMELIQFWVNAPAEFKMNEPHYHPLAMEDTPKAVSDDKKVAIGVVSGEFKSKKGAIDTYTPILTLRLDFEEGGKTDIPIPKSYNAFVYLLDGKLTVNGGTDAESKSLVWLENDGDYITLEACENTRAIVLAGEPINEPVATHGPFVMNTQSEILQAMRDYQKGEMGVLNEVFE